MNHESLKHLLEDCLEASYHCSHTCMREKENDVLTRCSKLNHTVVIICTLVMRALAGRSELLSPFCRLCIEICNSCAEECEKFTVLEHCRQSAFVCRKTADACLFYLATVPDYSTLLKNERYELY